VIQTMNSTTIFVFVLAICVCVLTANGQDPFDLTRHLNTKTPYFYSSDQFNSSVPETCEPIHINYLSRHGARAPSDGDVSDLLQLEELLSANAHQITNPNFFWMQTWVSPYSDMDAGLLSSLGEEEVYNISKRFLERFPTIFGQTYYPYLLPIQTTQVSRAAMSGNSFGFGLLEGQGEIGASHYQGFYTYSETPELDITLRFFDNCDTYNNLLNNESITQNSNMYLEQFSAGILTKVKNLLGLASNSTWNLDFNTVNTFYTACTFDISRDMDSSKFCSLFDPSDFEVYEYTDDLLDYYEKGYGSPLAYEISCPLLVDFFDMMNNVVNQSVIQNAKLRFAHAETIIPFASLLGLFNDSTTLQWNSSPNTIQNRKWRTSVISAFAANIAFVLYNCSGEFKVQLLYNEQPMQFPQCNFDLCPYSTFLKLYGNIVEQCNFDKMCTVPAQTPIIEGHTAGVSTVVIVLLCIAFFVFGIISTVLLGRFLISKGLLKPKYFSLE